MEYGIFRSEHKQFDLVKKTGRSEVYNKILTINNTSRNEVEHTKATVQRCSVKKVFLEISQNSQENTCARASFLIKLQAATFFYRTPLVAAFEHT